MNEVIKAAADLQALCEAERRRFCFIGELAVRRWGEPRETRAKDWMDVEGVIVRQSGRLDWEYVHSQLEPLLELKEVPELLVELERRRAEFDR